MMKQSRVGGYLFIETVDVSDLICLFVWARCVAICQMLVGTGTCNALSTIAR